MRIGGKGKKTATAVQSQAYTKQGVTADKGLVPDKKGSSGGGSGFNENDIEFMKKAIQILC